MQQVDDGFDVNITARAEHCPKPHHLDATAVALSDITNITCNTAKSISPGSRTEICYLSPSQVSANEKLTVTYTAEKVIMCYQNGMFLTHGHVRDDPKDVMIILQAMQVCR